MIHIAASGLATPLPEASRLRITPILKTRNIQDAADVPVDLDQYIDYRICRLRMLHQERDRIVAAGGFRLRLVEPVRLVWARLRLIPTSPGTTVTSLFPRLVLRSELYTGSFEVGADDRLDRMESHTGEAGGSDTRFDPLVIGGKTSTGAFWDFHSLNGQIPVGTDQITFIARTPASQAATFLLQLLLSVSTGEMEPEIYLQASSETATIEGARSDS